MHSMFVSSIRRSGLCLTVLASVFLTAGCVTVGPDYAGPPELKLPQHFSRSDQTTAVGLPLAAWWTTLGDPVLNDLMQHALAANPNLAQAEARLWNARGTLRQQKANQAPTLGTSVGYARMKIPPIDMGMQQRPGTTDNLFNDAFDATWEIDIFGGKRRAVEGARADLGTAEAQLADAQVSLTAEVAQAYVNLRSTQVQFVTGRTALQHQEDIVKLTEMRVQGGTAARTDLIQQQNQAESDRAQLASLQASIDAYRDALAVLVGQPPGALDMQLATEQPRLPLPPATVTISDPGALIQHRPDVRAAERQLASRTAQIGQAEAARFPQVKLMGFIGLGGPTVADMSNLNNAVMAVSPMLSWNFMDFGRAKARVSQAEAARDAAEAQYDAAVLTALRDAEDSLSRYGHARTQVASWSRAQSAADESVTLMRERQEAGTVSKIQVLNAQRQLLTAKQSLTQAEASMTLGYVSLQKALGLGWGTQQESEGGVTDAATGAAAGGAAGEKVAPVPSTEFQPLNGKPNGS
jgi:NodT family efflux transporter outer membrane factor (OMF) lipoprotein